ncbi:MAG: hypothetical protein QOE65_1054 [Solirubrobacteraceae bacterium]|jgi:hypothetical protein|nr:hypothetical protein [Solirubrobacteraceae bacterium]
MTINEVATSLGGSPANQFVELLDPFDEPFLFPTGYRLAVYDAAGVRLGDQSVGGGMGIRDAGAPMLVGKGTAGATPDLALSVALPTSAGQVCFERGDGSQINCMRWGTITNRTGTLATDGPAPGDGQSLQVCSGQGKLGTPTPRADNSCTAPGPTPGPDRTKPVVSASVPRVTSAAAHARGVGVRVRSNEAGKARARLYRGRTLLRTVTAVLSANRPRTIFLRLPRNTTATAFTLRLHVTDAAGNARDLVRPVRLAGG